MVKTLKLRLVSAQRIVDGLDGGLSGRGGLTNLCEPLVELLLLSLDLPQCGLNLLESILCGR